MLEQIERALAWLQATQRPSGEFPTFTARRQDMLDAQPYACCVYTTTFVLHALRHFTHLSPTETLRHSAATFLRREAHADGSWSYEGRATQRVPPDFDDTACATAALLGLGERPSFAFYQLLWQNESAPGGPYFTWLGVNNRNHLLTRHLDALVQANVLFCASMADLELPGIVAYFHDLFRSGDLVMASDYCLTPHLLIYAIARAYADGPTPALTPLLPALQLAARSLATDNPFMLACKTASLAALATPDTTLLADLLAAQQPDGSWPLAAAYSGYPPHLDGSPALTTAIALDAIGRA